MNPAEFNPAWPEAEQADWFLFEFAMIPNEEWCLYQMHNGDRSCALGHCGARKGSVTPAAAALKELSAKYLGVEIENINDNSDECPPEFRQITTPKARVLKALEVIAEMTANKKHIKSR